VSTPSALERARAALARGDVLIAYDGARPIVDTDPDDVNARFILALALARSGAVEAAKRETAELQERVKASTSASARLREDADALVARLAKDDALAAHGEERRTRARAAAELYEAVADRYQRHYSCVNAASLWLIGGDEQRARALATRARVLAAEQLLHDEEDDTYWRLATDAEAALVLGDLDAARASLARAAEVAPDDHGARATTRRQLLIVGELVGAPADLADPLRAPTVLHYCGHMLDGPDAVLVGADDGRDVAVAVKSFLDDVRVGFAFGSLACGADIVVAEQLLDRDVELAVVLPFAIDEFETTSVARGGVDWVTRFHRCLERAASVTLASDSGFAGDDELFGYGASIAMGHALNRAAFLGADAVQLAIWDGEPAQDAAAGTAHDIAVWERSGLRSHVIRTAPRRASSTSSANARMSPRPIRAILFSDFRGFSRLLDQHFAAFVDEVLGTLGRVLHEHGDALLWRNTWGDAIQAVFSDVAGAARCALALQHAIAGLDLPALDLPVDMGLRVAGHVGPVLQLTDPVTGGPRYWGRELTRAARIEPRTPEGEVYVTDAFAALLALEPDAGIRSDYVGRLTTAKDFETIPMYRLRTA
jgi:adenylate cyclase